MRSPMLWLALACHLFLATGYAVLTPSFEGPDENSHYEYAWHIANAAQLPLSPGLASARGLPQTEGAVLAHHPPLYYALLAVCLATFGEDDTVFGPIPNPTFGDPASTGQHLHFLHGGDETSPWGEGRQVLLGLRLVSVLLGLASIFGVHRLGRVCCPAQPAVADTAALLVSCLPMWSFLHGVLNSDNLATLLATVTVLMLVKIARSERLATGTVLGTGVLLALALLTKLTALFLAPLTVVVFALAIRRDARAGHGRRALVLTLGSLVTTIAISGWMFVRNAQLYGDPLALSAHDAAFQPIPAEFRWHYFWGTAPWPASVPSFLPDVFTSLLGRFGWFHLPPHPALVWAGAALTVCACLGLVLLAFDRSRMPRPLWLLVGACLLVFAGTAHFNLTAPQPQGRLLFPAVGPAAVLFAAGLLRLGQMLHMQRVGRWLCALPPLVGAVVLLLWFKPAFDPSLAPGPDHYASMVGGVVDEVHTPGIMWREPFPALPANVPPTLRWSDPGAGPDVLYSLYAYDDHGRVWLASYEWGVALRGGEAVVSEMAWSLLPKGRDLFLELRRVPDWRKGERLDEVPASAPLRCRRE